MEANMKTRSLLALALAFASAHLYAQGWNSAPSNPYERNQSQNYPNSQSRDTYEQRESQNYPYRGSSGTQYQYDLSKPSDQVRYGVDPAAQLRDGISVDPRREIDQSIGQQGGGIRR